MYISIAVYDLKTLLPAESQNEESDSKTGERSNTTP